MEIFMLKKIVKMPLFMKLVIVQKNGNSTPSPKEMPQDSLKELFEEVCKEKNDIQSKKPTKDWKEEVNDKLDKIIGLLEGEKKINIQKGIQTIPIMSRGCMHNWKQIGSTTFYCAVCGANK